METSDTQKVDNLDYCLKNLIAIDATPTSTELLHNNNLLKLSCENAQLLVNKIFGLNRTTTSDGVFAELPSTDEIVMPRVFPLPKPREKTRWEIFAELKGIKKRKRSRKVFDPTVNDWVPRWGYKSIKKNKLNKPPIMEVKPGSDDNVLDLESAKKSVMKSKQKLRELRNKMEQSARKDKSQLKKTLQRVKESTKGCGKHGKLKGKTKVSIKRKPVTQSLQSEKDSYLSSIKKLNL
ncbi:Ribosome biogenesis regulatory protein (RRS1) family protein [Theileria parva strain Muguga]|uniref:Ribosome biogenesis regulatory protein n=1 Tax=Theileria parva TaxID=5875 RepID=Q4N774_THEPA|nr:Ribosome biogenesis regulatory protein (RRS1) family protein [Theileria parva strain Muguga]EAN34184.1 Ribosome biogenesis regulatory protein (RRS1) family protein [Theileria parva strain Muguga]|eukprot:XP_766467.1 ribosome biogenesis regulatory protein [Theileria parva strain Muguga]